MLAVFAVQSSPQQLQSNKEFSMKNILIGSRAMQYWIPDRFSVKPTTDWDVISSEPIKGTEQHDRSLLNNANFDHYTSDKHTVDFNGTKLHVMLPVGLAIIKRSHLWRTIGFNKHIMHWHRHMKYWLWAGGKEAQVLLQERTAMTQAAYPQNGPNLMLSKSEFFDDAVKKVYDHDYLHSLFANYERPLYMELQKEHEIMCYEELWNNLTWDKKLLCVQEEVNVLATERFLVPSNFEQNTKAAYLKALEKVCTTVTKGWFRDFAIDNYPAVISVYNQAKIKEVQQMLQSK